MHDMSSQASQSHVLEGVVARWAQLARELDPRLLEPFRRSPASSSAASCAQTAPRASQISSEELGRRFRALVRATREEAQTCMGASADAVRKVMRRVLEFRQALECRDERRLLRVLREAALVALPAQPERTSLARSRRARGGQEEPPAPAAVDAAYMNDARNGALERVRALLEQEAGLNVAALLEAMGRCGAVLAGGAPLKALCQAVHARQPERLPAGDWRSDLDFWVVSDTTRWADPIQELHPVFVVAGYQYRGARSAAASRYERLLNWVKTMHFYDHEAPPPESAAQNQAGRRPPIQVLVLRERLATAPEPFLRTSFEAAGANPFNGHGAWNVAPAEAEDVVGGQPEQGTNPDRDAAPSPADASSSRDAMLQAFTLRRGPDAFTRRQRWPVDMPRMRVEAAVRAFDLLPCRLMFTAQNRLVPLQPISRELGLSAEAKREQTPFEWNRTLLRVAKYAARGFVPRWREAFESALDTHRNFYLALRAVPQRFRDVQIWRQEVRQCHFTMERQLASLLTAVPTLLLVGLRVWLYGNDANVEDFGEQRLDRENGGEWSGQGSVISKIAVLDPVSRCRWTVIYIFADDAAGAPVHSVDFTDAFLPAFTADSFGSRPGRRLQQQQLQEQEEEEERRRNEARAARNRLPVAERLEAMAAQGPAPEDLAPLPSALTDPPEGLDVAPEETQRLRAAPESTCFDFELADQRAVSAYLNGDPDPAEEEEEGEEQGANAISDEQRAQNRAERLILIAPPGGSTPERPLVGSESTCYTRGQLRALLADPTRVIVRCARQNHVGRTDLREPFVRLDTGGLYHYLVPVRDVQRVADGRERAQIYQVVPTGAREPFTASADVVFGNENAYVSGSHCQAGTEEALFRLRPVRDFGTQRERVSQGLSDPSPRAAAAGAQAPLPALTAPAAQAQTPPQTPPQTRRPGFFSRLMRRRQAPTQRALLDEFDSAGRNQ